MFEQLAPWVAVFVMAVAAVFAMQHWYLRRSNCRDHALGRERLDLLLSVAQNANFVITEGNFEDVGGASAFTLMRNEGDLRCKMEITQGLDRVNIWFSALGASHEIVLNLPKTFSEAIWIERLLADARQAWDAHKAEKLSATIA